MSDADFIALSQRLARAELELSLLRQRLGPGTSRRRVPAAWRSAVIGLVGASLVGSWLFTDLRAQGAGTTIKAPLTIVDGQNRPIIVVGEWPNGKRGISVRNAANYPAVTMGSTNVGAGAGQVSLWDGASDNAPHSEYVKLDFSKDGKARILLHSAGDWENTINGSSMVLKQGEQNKATIKAFDGGGSLYLYGGDTNDKLLAYLGASKSGETSMLQLGSKAKDTVGVVLGTTPAGSGAAQVFGSGGYLSAQLNASIGYSAFNQSGDLVTRLGPVPSGNNGEIALFNSKGDAIVEAGMLADGKGSVRAGPFIGGSSGGIVEVNRLTGKLK